ncbi:PabA [Desulforapulum autotrophicum HRM2]|uniref:PabA n=1 Tax=Desulforapulum autotrophicum (strain ATCC 43914 / DSM 3382 / VKM B-1955 / HRM2) TaxID=177437 RepID=C0QJS0_DESAH|nr:PabA [Desulforapulum autotrophicum HRM2]
MITFKKRCMPEPRLLLPRLLVIDNYDSFTYNLVQMFMHYNLAIKVHRSDKISIKGAIQFDPDYILISPGPKDPAHSGISIPLIKTFYQKIPVLGVCLGMQCINEAFGGTTPRAPIPMHGKTSSVHHNNQGIFKGMPCPFVAARYHSLMIKPPEPTSLTITAQSADGVIMGISHPHLPLSGLQFHPESFLTENGFLLIENFLKQGALDNSLSREQYAAG